MRYTTSSMSERQPEPLVGYHNRQKSRLDGPCMGDMTHATQHDAFVGAGYPYAAASRPATAGQFLKCCTQCKQLNNGNVIS